VLLRFGESAPDISTIERAFASRGVPLAVESIAEPDAVALYEHRLVLVRPDGHVAWRGNDVPDNPEAVVDRVRGA